jgi:SpoIID/LytB domain protein
VGKDVRLMRKLLALLAAAVASLPVPSAAAVPVLVIEGRGWGHGVGMAQDGAYWMGRAGARTEQILGHFYRGTRIGRAGGPVRVPVWEADRGGAAGTWLRFPDGGEVRDGPSGAQSPGFPVTVPRGGQVRVSWDGRRYRVDGAAAPAHAPEAAPPTLTPTQETPPTPEPTLPPPPTPDPTTPPPPTAPSPERPVPGPPPPPAAEPPTPVSTRPLVAVPNGGGTVEVLARSRRYRGTVEVTGATGRLRLVNQLDVEQYLRGMGEVLDPAWPPAALRAQAIAARTYALLTMAVRGEICETQRCQVYLGAQAEYAAMNRAVEATAGQVVVFGSRLASAVYSANGGGVSASSEEGFGTSGLDYPYLRPGPYTTRDPFPWTVRVALADVGRRFGYRGKVTDVRVGRTGPSARALEVVIAGNQGAITVPGILFDAGLGLRSTLFTLRQEEAAVAPPPPPAEELIQAPPDQLGDPVATVIEASAPDVVAPPSPAATPLPRPSDGRASALGGTAAMVLAGVAGELARVARHWRVLLFRDPMRDRRGERRTARRRRLRLRRRSAAGAGPEGS